MWPYNSALASKLKDLDFLLLSRLKHLLAASRGSWKSHRWSRLLDKEVLRLVFRPYICAYVALDGWMRG